MSREMAHKVIVPKKKIMSQSFLNSGTLVILCLFATLGPQFYPFIVFFLHINSDMYCRENHAKYPSLAKNPPKYTTVWRRHVRHNQTVRQAVEYCTIYLNPHVGG
jgi:hypothetical protein